MLKAAVLSALLSVSLLSGCGDQETESNEIMMPAQPENTAAAMPEGEENDADKAVYDNVTLKISEVMTSNKTTLSCLNACFPDWIEIYNYGDDSVSTGGLYLSDDENELTKWQFPEGTIQPGGYLIVLCSDSIENDCGYPCADFKLGKEGCEVYLSDSCSVKDCVCVPALDSDQSYLPRTDEITREVTPGYSNDSSGREAYLSAHSVEGKLIINEVAVYNDSYNRLAGCYPDWVELKNCSDEPILLSDYTIGDGTSEDKQRRLPDKTLLPGKLYIVYFVGDDHPSLVSSTCFDISLSSSGEQLYLFDSDGTLVDCAGIYDTPLRGTVGRMESGDGLFLFSKGSPGKDNSNGFRTRCDAPAVSIEPGCYDGIDSITVELSGEGDIYYTLDGSEPDFDSERYSSPVVLSETTVLRTFCSSEDKLYSKVASYSYFINEDFELPVVSISADGFNKVYSKSAEYCDANISYYSDEGCFSKDCKFELHGTSSSSYPGKKSYKVTFADRYGGDLEYDVFGDEENTVFHSLLIRGTLVDCAEIHLFRDSIASLAVNRVYPENMDPLTLDNRYCILYVNGEYWGLHALREAYSPAYCANHLGGSEDDYIIGRPPFRKENEAGLSELIHGIADTDMSDPDNYAAAAEQIDMHSLALWYCVESYFNNHDSGNIRYTRNCSENGKWYVMAYDFDLAMTNGNAQWTGIINKEDTTVSKMLKSLLDSPEFCELLLSSAAELRDGGLSDALIRDLFEELVDEVSHDMPRNLAKWNISEMEYNLRIDSFRTFFEDGRIEMWIDRLQSLIEADNSTMHRYFPDIYS